MTDENFEIRLLMSQKPEVETVDSKVNKKPSFGEKTQ